MGQILTIKETRAELGFCRQQHRQAVCVWPAAGYAAKLLAKHHLTGLDSATTRPEKVELSERQGFIILYHYYYYYYYNI